MCSIEKFLHNAYMYIIISVFPYLMIITILYTVQYSQNNNIIVIL